MSTHEQPAGDWLDVGFAQEWAAGDIWTDLLKLPRELAAAIVQDDRPGAQLVVDVGSGPGVMLGLFLRAFPDARGVWVDVSPGMLDQARASLGALGERVSYELADVREFARLGGVRGADVIMTSRAIHHLPSDDQRRFYADAAGLLAPGGWLINIDHTLVSPGWADRLAAVRGRFTRQVPHRAHPHEYPFLAPDTHLAALRAAGIEDAAIPWRAFSLCLMMGRKAG